jgi:hypothetical protein
VCYSLQSIDIVENNMGRNAKGYSYHQASGRWFAYISKNGKQHSLGYHKTEAAAAEARAEAMKAQRDAGYRPPDLKPHSSVGRERLLQWKEYHEKQLNAVNDALDALDEGTTVMSEQEEAIERLVMKPHRDKQAAEFKGFL